MIEAVEIEGMSVTERLQAMEMLWRSMTHKASKVKSPAWHGNVLAQRLTQVEAGKGRFCTVSQLKQRLARHAILEPWSFSPKLRPT
jgi:hypothetical protein